MSFIKDIRTVSEAAVGQVAGRFNDLPRPLLAAIGAGDMAVQRLAELREQIMSNWAPGVPEATDVKHAAEGAKEFAAELPAMVQKVAAGVFESVEQFADQAPARTQKLVAELPEKLSEIRDSLTQDQLRESVEAYTQLAGMLYGSLAERGDKSWTKVLAAAGVDPKVVEAKPAKDAKVEKPAKEAKVAKEAKPKDATPAEKSADDVPAGAKDAAAAPTSTRKTTDGVTIEPHITDTANEAAAAPRTRKVAAKPTPAEEASALEAVAPVRKPAARKVPAPKPATHVMDAPKKEPVVEVTPTPTVD